MIKEYEFHEIAEMFPLMENEDLIKLAEDINLNGLKEKIMLWEGKILDGRNRYNACKSKNIEPEYRQSSFKTRDQAEDYVISENLHRRHLSKDQKAIILVEKVLPIYEERARRRMLEGKKIEMGDNKEITQDKDPSHNFMTRVETQRSAQELAQKENVGINKIQKAKKITEMAKVNPFINQKKKEIEQGKTTIDNVYTQIQKKENKDKPLTPLPLDEYDVIYADPPWFYEGGTTPNRIIENQYPTMETKDICKMKIPSNKDSILFLWCTNPKIEEGLQVIKAWGFEYKTNMVWIKDKIGMGYYARGRHELLLIATKGSPGVPNPENRPDSVIEAPRTEHSKKPRIVYELIEKMYPDRKYLELFARNTREKWKSWGNEI